jgi:hypothetical protein
MLKNKKYRLINKCYYFHSGCKFFYFLCFTASSLQSRSPRWLFCRSSEWGSPACYLQLILSICQDISDARNSHLLLSKYTYNYIQLVHVDTVLLLTHKLLLLLFLVCLLSLPSQILWVLLFIVGTWSLLKHIPDNWVCYLFWIYLLFLL